MASYPHSRPVFTYQFSRRKHLLLRKLLNNPHIKNIRSLAAITEPADLYVWGAAQLRDRHRSGHRIIRVEDGFIRSIGLGAALTAPQSWCVDPVGLYLDATRPSLLETVLENNAFTLSEIARAAALRQRIIASGITKYNLGGSTWQRPRHAGPVLLVPGQVESDESLRFGRPAFSSHLALVKHVRALNPLAYIIFKTHPDVSAGLRPPSATDPQVALYCNEIVKDVSTSALLDSVDEVHTLTSLIGFEGLLRGKTIFVYGQPFYAGWGLTHDYRQNERRMRRLSIDELIAGCLIEYPHYFPGIAKGSDTPEDVITRLRLESQRLAAQGNFTRFLHSLKHVAIRASVTCLGQR